MSVFRFVPKHLKRRASRFRPKSFPDHYAYAAFFDLRAKLFDGDDMMVLEYPDRATQELLFRHAVEKLDLKGKKIIDLGCGLGYLKKYLDESGSGLSGWTGSRGVHEEAFAGILPDQPGGNRFHPFGAGEAPGSPGFYVPAGGHGPWCKEELSGRVVLDDWGSVTYVVAVYKGS